MKERIQYHPTGETWADRTPKIGDLVDYPHCLIRPMRVSAIRTLAYLIASAQSHESRARYRRTSPQGLVVLTSLDGRTSVPVPLGVDMTKVAYLKERTQ